MGLSLHISAVQTYDRKVIPLKLSPIVDMVLKEDEEAEDQLSSDWTAGTSLSNTYGLSVLQHTARDAEIMCVNAGGVTCCEVAAHARAGALTFRTELTRGESRKTVKMGFLYFQMFRKRQDKMGSSAPRRRATCGGH